MPPRLLSFISSSSPLQFRNKSYSIIPAFPPRRNLVGNQRRISRIIMSHAAVQSANTFKVALCQMPVTADKHLNLKVARDYLDRAHAAGAKLAILPECFNSPYDTACFREYAEALPDPSDKDVKKLEGSPSLEMIRNAAINTGMYIVGGSIPEIDPNQNVYNTCMCVDPKGNVIAKHRKAHLFDISVPGGITFRESDALSAGQKATTFSAADLGCKIGVGICYDMRFPELAMLQTQRLGANLLVFPGAFNMTTGPPHWELLIRARALDNQVFVAACSPARAVSGDGYKAWGHSMLVDAWGSVVAKADEKEALVVGEINLGHTESVRKSIPTSLQRRTDMYKIEFVEGRNTTE